MLTQRLFRLARWPPMGPMVALGLRYAGRLLPLRRVWWSPGLIGFYHPQPSWREHSVLVPTTPVRDLLALGQPRCAPLFADIVLAAGEVLRRSGAAPGPYVLCANGGLRQDVQQVHFHLLPGERWVAPVAHPGPTARLVTSIEPMHSGAVPRPNPPRVAARVPQRHTSPGPRTEQEC